MLDDRVVGVGRSRLVEIPVSGIVVPYDGLQAENTLSNSSNSVVDIAEWRSPVSGYSATVEV